MFRRRTQPLEMSLLNLMKIYLPQLEIIWTKIGFLDKQVEVRGNAVCGHVEVLLKDMIDEESKLQKNMEKKIKRYSQQAASLKKFLCIDDSQESSLEHFALPSNETSSSTSFLPHGLSGSLLLKEKNARDEVIKLRKLKETRKTKVQLYIEREKKLCLLLDQNPKYTCDVDSYLTESNLASIGSRVEALQENYDRRMRKYETLRFNIMEKLGKYGNPTEADFMAVIVANAKPMFPLSDEKLQTIETMANNMISENAMEALKNELERLKKSEESRLQCQIEQTQQKLAKIKTVECRVHGECRGSTCSKRFLFIKKFRTNFVLGTLRTGEKLINVICFECEFMKLQDFLQQLQENVRVKEACAKDREFVVKKLQTWKASFDHLLELEEKSHDPSRLKNRGI
ncbi:unnamed protein product [Clavelina lepadiformis]|uniref:Uncharacterized protein n=1 Tax=Clavelina lepadiformis TaxID=159417 RepID=A0ABP0FKX1_CLALP